MAQGQLLDFYDGDRACLGPDPQTGKLVVLTTCLFATSSSDGGSTKPGAVPAAVSNPSSGPDAVDLPKEVSAPLPVGKIADGVVIAKGSVNSDPDMKILMPGIDAALHVPPKMQEAWQLYTTLDGLELPPLAGVSNLWVDRAVQLAAYKSPDKNSDYFEKACGKRSKYAYTMYYGNVFDTHGKTIEARVKERGGVFEFADMAANLFNLDVATFRGVVAGLCAFESGLKFPRMNSAPAVETSLGIAQITVGYWQNWPSLPFAQLAAHDPFATCLCLAQRAAYSDSIKKMAQYHTGKSASEGTTRKINAMKRARDLCKSDPTLSYTKVVTTLLSENKKGMYT